MSNTTYFSKIPNDVTQMSNNKNPIKMELFLSFLIVDVTRSFDHLGACNGWTELRGDNRLLISGGIVRGVEYLNNIQYMQNLHNKYNNYVNPFYIFDLLTDEGKQFFVKYCTPHINKIIAESDLRLEMAKRELEAATINKDAASTFWNEICKS